MKGWRGLRDTGCGIRDARYGMRDTGFGILILAFWR